MSLLATWMLPAPVLAGVPVEGILYMVVIVLWGIGRLFVKRKQLPPEEISPPSSPRPIDAELKELFETITGQKLEPIRRPPPPPQQERKPAPRRAQPTAQQAAPPRQVATPRPPRRVHPSLQTRPREATPPPVPQPAFRIPAPGPSAAEMAVLAEVAPSFPRGAPVAVALPSLTRAHHNATGHAMTLKLPSLRMGFGGVSRGRAGHMLDALRKPEGMRAAMTQRVVLGPPRALEPAS